MAKSDVLQIQHKERMEVDEEWKRIKILVQGNKKQFLNKDFFIPLPNEKQTSRNNRAIHFLKGFVNPTKSLLNSKADFIAKKGIKRDSPIEELLMFMKRADQYGQSLEEFMKTQASPNLAAYGTVFAVVDKPRIAFENKEQELQKGLPYLYILDPLDVINWSFSDSGELIWFRYKACPVVDNSNPFDITKEIGFDFITWTQTEFYRHNQKGEQLDYVVHNFGIVPVAVQASNVMDSNKTLGRSSFADSSDYIIMANTNLSIANNEIFKYGSAMLLMSHNDISDNTIQRDSDPSTNLKKLAYETYEASDVIPVQDLAQSPKYLTKDITVVDKAKGQADYYFTLALDNEKSAKSVQNADQPQSGVAKSYDWQEIDGVLCAHAESLENFEKKILQIVSSILKVAPDFTIQYPRSFDTKGFQQKIDDIKALIDAQYPSKLGLSEAYKTLTPDITTEETIQSEINQEIETASEEVVAVPDTYSTMASATSGAY